MIGLLLMRDGASWWTAWRTAGRDDTRDAGRESRRPLLPAVPEVEEESVETVPRSYGSTPGEDAGPRGEQSPMNERAAWED